MYKIWWVALIQGYSLQSSNSAKRCKSQPAPGKKFIFAFESNDEVDPEVSTYNVNVEEAKLKV